MLRRRKPSCLRIAAPVLILAALSLALPASAVSATRTYFAVNVHCDVATFKIGGLNPATVRAARVTLGQRDARVKPAVVRRAARRGTLRLRLSTLRWTSLRTHTHKRRTAKRGGQERNTDRHRTRAARREKHTSCRNTRARQAGVRRKRPKLTVTTSAPPNSTAPAPPPVDSTSPPGFPASFFAGPAGDGNVLPPGGYPSTRVWAGIWPCCGTVQDGHNQLLALEAAVGKKLDIRGGSNNGTCNFLPVDSYAANGWVPVITFSPNVYVNQISDGSQDGCFTTFARGVAAQPYKIILRLLHEFNGTWFRYSYWLNGDGTTRRATGPEFKAAWQHIVDIFRREGAFPKVSLMLNYDEGFYNNGDVMDEAQAYPGDAYVDWVSSDGYNHNASGAWCGTHAGWCEFSDVFAHGRPAPTNTPIGVEKDFRGIKPYAVAETGTLEAGDGGAKKGQWHRNAGSYITNQMPGAYAYIYFDVNYTDGDWRVRTSTESLNGFRDMVHMPRFGG